MYQYVFTDKARQQLVKLDQATRQRIIAKLDFFVSQSNPLQFSEPLVGFKKSRFRFRVGDYRIIFRVDPNQTLVILLIGHRREIYR